ncbi:hypothetical protein EJ08DRAFT_646734 [Tothia fuscella]|uniref:Secreted protein n=1 Tax=Tothia fuscella TaxID=1048955 RepID=A0A9P4NYX7_9PEZI|nr:hypothetical protein EJ08DRAFT_646734 [Tothia fuscella]
MVSALPLSLLPSSKASCVLWATTVPAKPEGQNVIDKAETYDKWGLPSRTHTTGGSSLPHPHAPACLPVLRPPWTHFLTPEASRSCLFTSFQTTMDHHGPTNCLPTPSLPHFPRLKSVICRSSRYLDPPRTI